VEVPQWLGFWRPTVPLRTGVLLISCSKSLALIQLVSWTHVNSRWLLRSVYLLFARAVQLLTEICSTSHMESGVLREKRSCKLE
jgi:hypothetical protein